MEKVSFNITTTADFFVARLDDKKLRFLNGAATAKLQRGQKYNFQWFVRGAPGSSYKIEITEPEELKFNHEATLTDDQKAAGSVWLQLEAKHAKGQDEE